MNRVFRTFERFVLRRKKLAGLCFGMLCLLALILINAGLSTDTHHTLANKYFVNTSYCRIPHFEPFDADARRIFKPQPPMQCSDDEQIVMPVYVAQKQQYYLHFNERAINKYRHLFSFIGPPANLLCTYQEVFFLRSDDTSRKGYVSFSAVQFDRDIPVSQDTDGLIVRCFLRTSHRYIRQVEAFPLIQHKEDGPKVSNASRDRKPSVLLIGIDSLSHMNFRRNMPRTFAYLMKRNWFELQGYSTVGLDYYANALALLTGFNWTNAPSACMPAHVGGLEQCGFLWKTFKKFNYRTALADDATSYSSWNFPSPGFREQPTDYYLRPTLLAAEENLWVKLWGVLAYCIGRKHVAEYVYDFALELVRRYMDGPIFGLFWTSSFSRKAFDNSSAMDQRILEYFKSFEHEGVFEKSIVMFLSNHGSKSGPLMNFTQGFFERRLPMFFISLPKWFQRQFPQYVQALAANRNRLTSPYDVHMTLKHILELFEAGVKLPPAEGCPKCQSIFVEVPENRSCDDAGISYNWCACF